MKTLVAPLNWGLGHASRCIPVVKRLLKEGHDVTLGGDGASLRLLQRHFPTLPVVQLAPLELHYSKSDKQLCSLLMQLPKVRRWAKQEQHRIQELQSTEHFEQIISDNRPFLYIPGIKNCYITHQLCVMAPPFSAYATAIHHHMMHPFQEIWVPDFKDPNNSLAGELSHPHYCDERIRYIGPQSRFSTPDKDIQSEPFHLAILSGLEPQRSLLEQKLIERYRDTAQQLLIVQGKMEAKQHTKTMRNISFVNYLNDDDLLEQMLRANHIICRSGYSSIMDLHTLGLLNRTELIPTPGQPEQEYLAELTKQP